MYVCVHACMYVCMYVCTYACMYVQTYASVNVCVYVSLSGLWTGMFSPRLVCLGLMSARIHVCTYVCMHVHMYVRTYACMVVFVYVCMYVCMSVRMNVCMCMWEGIPGRDSSQWGTESRQPGGVVASQDGLFMCARPRIETQLEVLVQFCSSAQGVGGRPQAETFCCHARPLKD